MLKFTVHVHHCHLQCDSSCSCCNWPVQSSFNLQDDSSIKDLICAMSLSKSIGNSMTHYSIWFDKTAWLYLKLWSMLQSCFPIPSVPLTVFTLEIPFSLSHKWTEETFQSQLSTRFLSPLLLSFHSPFFYELVLICSLNMMISLKRDKLYLLPLLILAFLWVPFCTFTWPNTVKFV